MITPQCPKCKETDYITFIFHAHHAGKSSPSKVNPSDFEEVYMCANLHFFAYEPNIGKMFLVEKFASDNN